MFDLLLWLWLSLLAFALGRLIVGLIFRASRCDEFLYAAGVGFGTLVLGMIVLGFLGLYNSTLLWALLGGSTVALIVVNRRNFPILWPLSIRGLFRERRSPFEWFCLGAAVLICIRNVLGSLTPELRHDVLDYHINFPNLYTLHHGFYETSWHVFSYMPANVETLYTLSLLLAGDTLAKLLHSGFGLLAAASVYRIGQRYFGRFVASWALFFWLTISHVSYVASTAYIDLGVSFWAFLAVGSLLRYFEALGVIRPAGEGAAAPGADEARRWLLLCGLFTGWTLGSKYTAILLFAVPLILTLVILAVLPEKLKGGVYRPRQARRAVLTIAVWSVLFLSPWLARNLAWTGNPVYPFFNRALGLNSPAEISAETFIRDHAPHFPDWSSMAELLSKKINHLAIDGTLVINLAILLIPLLILRWIVSMPDREPKRESPRRFLYVFAGLFFALVYGFWVLGTGNLDGRFMMPGYMVLCWLLAAGYRRVFQWFESLLSWKRFARSLPFVLSVILLWSYTSHMIHFYQDLGESPWPLLTRGDRAVYLRRRFQNYDITEYIEANLPAESLILGIGYPTRRPYISHVKHGVHLIKSRLGERDYSAEELRGALQQEGISHLVAPGVVAIHSEALDRLEEAGFRPIFRSRRGRGILYEVPRGGEFTE